MIYTSAIYANAQHTMVTGTDAMGATETVPLGYTVFRQPEHGPQAFLAGGGVIADYVGPEANQSFRLYKSTLIRRLTDPEAETLSALLAASPVKSQMLWNASEWLGSDDPLFTTLEQTIAGELGASRASELLAPDA